VSPRTGSTRSGWRGKVRHEGRRRRHGLARAHLRLAGRDGRSGEFLDSLRFEIGAKEVYVFTPKGRVIGLPAGGTPVDFAYAVHTEVGHRTMGAKVNGRLVPLESELHSGDVVEVFTSKNPDAGPARTG
jgi:(p)ppGpp synthase/HD superfamily hydrolase